MNFDPTLIGFTHESWAAHIEAIKLEMRDAYLIQVNALLDADWKFEIPEIVNGWKKVQSSEPWQWYWRRPPKRKNSKGRRFLSTNQAFMALQREAVKV